MHASRRTRAVAIENHARRLRGFERLPLQDPFTSMMSQLIKLVVLLLATHAATLDANEGWPKDVERAWLIMEAKVFGADEGGPRSFE